MRPTRLSEWPEDPTFFRVMLGYTLVDAFTPASQQEAVARLKSAIASVHGVIVDFAVFANQAVRLSVELETGELDRFRSALESNDVHLLGACKTELEQAPRTHKPITAMLYVALVSGEPDLETHDEKL